jgi:hypothetical protein
VKSWLAANPGGADLGPKDVAGTVAGQVYYGRQRTAGAYVYWALAEFEPAPTVLADASTAAGQIKMAQFENTVYVFSWKSGPVWTLLGAANTGVCPRLYVPTAVLAVWGLCGVHLPA